MIDENRPIFFQVAERIENDIIAGTLVEESQVPSTNEFAASYRINPATAAKGFNVLVDQGILYKKRGVGMFVSSGARQTVLVQRRERFLERYVVPMMGEAEKLGISPKELAGIVLNGNQKTV